MKKQTKTLLENAWTLGFNAVPICKFDVVILYEIQDWLRKEHKIDVCVYPVELIKGNKSIEQDKCEYTYWIFIKGAKEFPLSSQIHDTFEVTLEHALNRALNLIK